MPAEPVRRATEATLALARATSAPRLEAVARRALAALDAAGGGAEPARLRAIAAAAPSAASPLGADMLTCLQDIVEAFPMQAQSRQTVRDWGMLMKLAAQDDRLAEKVAQQRLDPVERHRQSLAAAFGDGAAYERAVDELLDDKAVSAAEQKAFIADLTRFKPAQLSSKEKRRHALLAWRFRERDRDAIFHGEARGGSRF